jgi:NADH-quinone oxidoreductase subunit I
MKFGMFFVGEYVAVTLVSALIVTLFFGGWLGPWLPGIVWFLIKTGVFITVFVVARGTFPRPRYDQLMSLGWKALLPLSLVNLLVTGAIVVERGQRRHREQHAPDTSAANDGDDRRWRAAAGRWCRASTGRSSPRCRRRHRHRSRLPQPRHHPVPGEMVYLPPRYRGRIILSRDPAGEERCVACYLCSAACPVDCIALQATQDENGRRYPEWFRINFSRCIFCGFCEEACPTYAIQLTPDFEMSEYHRQNLVYEKEDLLISGQGKYHGYNFYKVAGLAIGGKDKAGRERPRCGPATLMP